MYIDTYGEVWKASVAELAKKKEEIKEQQRKQQEEEIGRIRNSVSQVMDILPKEGFSRRLKIPKDQTKNFLICVSGENGKEEKEVTRVDERLFVKMGRDCGLSIREDTESSEKGIKRIYVISI